MTPSFRAFTNELLAIKLAAIDDQLAPDQQEGGQTKRPDNVAMFKRMLLNSAIYGGGLGLGMGLGYVGAEKLLPKAFPALTPKQRMMIEGAISGLTGLGILTAAAAAKHMIQSEDDAAYHRNNPRV